MAKKNGDYICEFCGQTIEGDEHPCLSTRDHDSKICMAYICRCCAAMLDDMANYDRRPVVTTVDILMFVRNVFCRENCKKFNDCQLENHKCSIVREHYGEDAA